MEVRCKAPVFALAADKPSPQGGVVAAACSTQAAVPSAAHDACEAASGLVRKVRRTMVDSLHRCPLPTLIRASLSWYKYEGLRIAKGQALVDWVADNPNLQA